MQKEQILYKNQKLNRLNTIEMKPLKLEITCLKKIGVMSTTAVPNTHTVNAFAAHTSVARFIRGRARRRAAPGGGG